MRCAGFSVHSAESRRAGNGLGVRPAPGVAIVGTELQMAAKGESRFGYVPVTDLAMRSGFYLTGAGWELIAPHEPYPQPTHPDMYSFNWIIGRTLPEYQLNYIHKGRGTFETREGIRPIRAGDALLLLPEVWHRYRPDPHTGWENYWISFNGQIPHIWEAAGIINARTAVRRIGSAEAFVEDCKRIIEAVVSPQVATSLKISLAGLVMVAGVLGDTTAAPPGPSLTTASAVVGPTAQREDPWVRGALHQIWSHSHRDLSVYRIADRLGVNRRTLERHFLAACGHTVLEAITACRLARAQWMLRNTHLPIKRIAYASGFSSPTHLAMVFQRKLKMTPGACRAGEPGAASGTAPVGGEAV